MLPREAPRGMIGGVTANRWDDSAGAAESGTRWDDSWGMVTTGGMIEKLPLAGGGLS